MDLSNSAQELYELRTKIDAAYAERDKCVALLVRMALALGLVAGMGKHQGEDWEDDWRNIAFIELPSGQVSWHIHTSEMGYFEGLPMYSAPWDGHDTNTKYARALDPQLTPAHLLANNLRRVTRHE